MVTSTRPPESDGAAETDSKYRQRYDEMLDAAADVFAARGYHGASTKDIAERLGIRQGSLYYYFPSKQEALAEVCRRGVEGFVSRFGEVTARHDTVAAAIRAGVGAHLAPMLTHRPYVKVFLKERKNLAEENRRRVGRTSRAYEMAWEDLVARGVGNGELREGTPARTVVLGLLGMMNGTFDWFEGTPDDLDNLADAYTGMILDGIGGVRR